MKIKGKGNGKSKKSLNLTSNPNGRLMAETFAYYHNDIGEWENDFLYLKIIFLTTQSELSDVNKTYIDIFTLYRSRVWIGMKVLPPNSIISGTRKLGWIFPIRQLFWTIQNVQFGQIWQSRCTMVKKLSQNFCLVLNIFTIKKSCRGIKFLFNWKNSP